MSRLPLVSVLMPTYDRPEFLRRAVAIFQAYRYPNKELIIVDDSLTVTLVSGANVRYIRLSERTILGAKHNIAAGLAQGELLAYQDDDDLFSPMRLTRQAEPIIMDQADLTGFPIKDMLSFPSYTWLRFTKRARFKPGLYTSGIYLPKFHDSTAMYRREIWDLGIQHPNIAVFEKAELLNDAIRAGYRPYACPNDTHFVYARHDRNVWKIEAKNFVKTQAPRPLPLVWGIPHVA